MASKVIWTFTYERTEAENQWSSIQRYQVNCDFVYKGTLVSFVIVLT